MVSLDGRQKITSKRMLAGLGYDHFMTNVPRNRADVNQIYLNPSRQSDSLVGAGQRYLEDSGLKQNRTFDKNQNMNIPKGDYYPERHQYN